MEIQVLASDMKIPVLANMEIQVLANDMKIQIQNLDFHICSQDLHFHIVT
jgi:hypothetical protein